MAGLRCCGVMETDSSHGRPDFAQEARRAVLDTKRGDKVHEHAEQHIRLLDEVCFIPLRRQQHEMAPMIHEIIRQSQTTSQLEPLPQVRASGAEPQPQPQPHDGAD